MYILNFEARAFLGGNMHALVQQQISQLTVSKMKQRQQPRGYKEKQATIILGIRVTEDHILFQF